MEEVKEEREVRGCVDRCQAGGDDDKEGQEEGHVRPGVEDVVGEGGREGGGELASDEDGEGEEKKQLEGKHRTGKTKRKK